MLMIDRQTQFVVSERAETSQQYQITAMLKMLSYGNDTVKYPSWPSSVQQTETGCLLADVCMRHAMDIFRENSLNWD